MTGAPPITAESERLSRNHLGQRSAVQVHRSEGATISEDDYRPIDPNFQLPPSRFKTNWLPEILDEIDRLAQLPPGWDSNGADPVEPEAAAIARRLIGEIADPYLGLPRPTAVTATRSGGIQFEWGVHDGAYFELECVDRNTLEYFLSDPRRQEEVEGAICFGDDLHEILSYIRRTKQIS